MKLLFSKLILLLILTTNSSFFIIDINATFCDRITEIKEYIRILSYSSYPKPEVDCEKQKVRGFDVYDMLDTTNYIKLKKIKLKFIPNHLYHTYHWNLNQNSHLIYVEEDGKLTFFERLNCREKGNSLKDVENHINSKNISQEEKNKLLEVLPNYRDFGFYMGGCGSARFSDCD